MIDHELYNCIDDAYKRLIIHSHQKIKVKKGEYLFWQGSDASHIYYVKSGNLKVFKTSINGNETIFDIYDPDTFIALGVLFNDPQRYPASCSAVTNATVIALPTKLIQEAIISNPLSAERWIAYTNKRLTIVQQKLSELIFADSQERLRNLIRYFKDKYPTTTEGTKVTIQVPITKQEMADILNVRRETLSRMLASLKEQEVCSFSYKEITVDSLWLTQTNSE